MSPKFLSLVLMSVSLGALAMGCDVPPAGEEAAEQALIGSKIDPLTYGPTTRFRRISCMRTCVKFEQKPRPPKKPGQLAEGIPPAKCLQYGEDCERNVSRVTLHEDESAAANDQAYPPAGAPDAQPYMGCGVTAAQNVAWFYGKTFPLSYVARVIEAFHAGEDSIATSPTNLERDLKRLMDAPDATYAVKRRSGVGPSDIRDELLKGNPVVLMVNGGQHWMTATGYQHPDRFLVMDYSDNNPVWKSFGELNMDMGTQASVGNFFDRLVSILPLVEYESYQDRTMVTIRRSDRPW